MPNISGLIAYIEQNPMCKIHEGEECDTIYGGKVEFRTKSNKRRVEESATYEGIEQNASQCEGIETIGGDKIIRTFSLDVFHSFCKTKNSNDEIDEVGKRIDRLAYKSAHISIFAEILIDITLKRKPLPKATPVGYFV